MNLLEINICNPLLCIDPTITNELAHMQTSKAAHAQKKYSITPIWWHLLTKYSRRWSPRTLSLCFMLLKSSGDAYMLSISSKPSRKNKKVVSSDFFKLDALQQQMWMQESDKNKRWELFVWLEYPEIDIFKRTDTQVSKFQTYPTGFHTWNNDDNRKHSYFKI